MTTILNSTPGAGEHERLRALAAYAILDTAPEQEFDDLAHLAADLCAAPVALVSFVGPDRQWFKARVGFPACETDLRSSVCRFVLSEPDLLIIPDLCSDARTCDNPLVIGEPGIRFYAGAPLRTPEGQVLGSLCVIDTEPRPNGLTARQADNLKRLARQVVGQLEARRRVVERDTALRSQQDAARALAASENHWRSLFENLREGFIFAEVVRDGDGRITDWRYLEVNQAWSDLVGIDAARALGQTIETVLPGIEQEWIDLGKVVDTGETLTFTQQVGRLDRWYEGRASPVGSDTFSVLFLEITERVRIAKAVAEAATRRAALAELGECLRTTLDITAMGHVAGSITGRTLSASRAGYGSVDVRRETVDIAADWYEPGGSSVAGVHKFRNYGSYINDLRAGRTVVAVDVRTDSRMESHAQALLALGIAALINVPVIEHGELVAIIFAHFREPRTITAEEEAFVRAVADRTRAGVGRLRAESQQAILNGEISHRLKNTLAMVQAIAAQTLKSVSDRGPVEAFYQRLQALGSAHDVLLADDPNSADLRIVVAKVMGGAGADDRYSSIGPTVTMGPRATLSTSLLIHELATNALKYGSLSAGGRVEIAWRVEGGELVIDWTETGGPEAHEPTRKGFGSRLLRGGLVGTGGSSLSYGNEGFRASFRAPLGQVQEA